MIQLPDNYYIEADPYNFILKRKVENNHSEQVLNRIKARGGTPQDTREVVLGYFPDLPELLNYYLNYQIKQLVATEDLEPNELFSKIESLKESIQCLTIY